MAGAHVSHCFRSLLQSCFKKRNYVGELDRVHDSHTESLQQARKKEEEYHKTHTTAHNTNVFFFFFFYGFLSPLALLLHSALLVVVCVHHRHILHSNHFSCTICVAQFHFWTYLQYTAHNTHNRPKAAHTPQE